MKKIITSVLLILSALFVVPSAFAHVSVKPAEVGVSKFQAFSVGVPVEKETATTAVRLLIPEGLQYVTPNVKPGWQIVVKKSGEGETAIVTEILWTGGSIPVGQRDEFMFSAKVPSEATSLNWKAYQTYADGEIVAWDADPKLVKEGDDDHNAPKPYSVTQVINDLATPLSVSEDIRHDSKESESLAMVISIAALVLSAVAIGLQIRSKKK